MKVMSRARYEKINLAFRSMSHHKSFPCFEHQSFDVSVAMRFSKLEEEEGGT